MRITISKATESKKTYFFRVELEQEDDGRWSAWIESLPGCAAWGYTKEEAIKAINDAAELYIEDMLACGEELPRDVMVTDALGILVTV